MKIGVSAKQVVNERAFLYCLLDISFYTRGTATFLTVSTVRGVQEYVPNYRLFRFHANVNVVQEPELDSALPRNVICSSYECKVQCLIKV